MFTKVLDKCSQCYKDCKMESATKAKLIYCPYYISKRSVKSNRSAIRQNNSKDDSSIGFKQNKATNQKAPLNYKLFKHNSMTDKITRDVNKLQN